MSPLLRWLPCGLSAVGNIGSLRAWVASEVDTSFGADCREQLERES